MKKIESVSNPLIASLYKLHEKKYRDETRKFLIEGPHLIEEANRSSGLEMVLIANENDAVSGVENILVTEAVINKLSFTKTPTGIIGVCSFFEEPKISGDRFLLLDNIQDPGNLGTLVRSALGFGIDLVVLNSQSVDIYNDKFIRSTQGAIFQIKILKADLNLTVRELKKAGVTVIGTSMGNHAAISELLPPKRYALLLGNEGQGVSPDLQDLADQVTFIPMSEKLESLNVAVAGSIIMCYLSGNLQK